MNIVAMYFRPDEKTFTILEKISHYLQLFDNDLPAILAGDLNVGPNRLGVLGSGSSPIRRSPHSRLIGENRSSISSQSEGSPVIQSSLSGESTR